VGCGAEDRVGTGAGVRIGSDFESKSESGSESGADEESKSEPNIRRRLRSSFHWQRL